MSTSPPLILSTFTPLLTLAPLAVRLDPSREAERKCDLVGLKSTSGIQTQLITRFALGQAAGNIPSVDNGEDMGTYTAVIERDQSTGLYIGYVPGWTGAHSQGESLDELRANLYEVMQMLPEDGEPALSTEFVGTQTLEVA